VTVIDQPTRSFRLRIRNVIFQSFGSVRMHGALPSLAFMPLWRDAYAVVEYRLQRYSMHSTFPRSSWHELH